MQKLYGLSNIEAAKRISQDFGLRLFDKGIATPVNPYLKEKNEMNLWIRFAKNTLTEYIDILNSWEKTYMPRSPIDPVSDRYLESIHRKAYAEMILSELSYGTDNDKKELYRTGREYVLGIKNGST